MEPSNVSDPRYYHKVVDCQWACPAHTNVPEYIRLIAQGRYTDSYMLNRVSNVFPGILGRTCDRPCEPACRRGRVDGKPVAICRLKRVAADLRDDIQDRLPVIPDRKNGKRIALVGAGPASLTVANDLMPLGYECVIYEKLPQGGGLMRYNIPAFRLPAAVLDEEVDNILNMGVDIRYETPVASLKALLDEEYDAVFVGSGAPRGKELDIPGRWDTDQVHIGIEWLGSVHFGHIEKIEPRVLIIGVGNTAMDCCRTSKRLGGTDVKVVARRSRPLLQGLAVGAGGRRRGGHRDRREPLAQALRRRERQAGGHGVRAPGVDRGERPAEEHGARHRDDSLRCRDPRHRTGQRVPVDRARHRARLRPQVGHADRGQDDVPEHARRGVLRRRRGVGTGEHHLGGGARASGGDLDPQLLSGRPGHRATRRRHESGQLRRWACMRGATTTTTTRRRARRCSTRNWSSGSPTWRSKWSSASRPSRRRTRSQRCLNCDIETQFSAKLCIECDACVDVCPVNCLTITHDGGSEADLRTHLSAPAVNLEQAIYASTPLPQTGRLMVKDEDVCLHCGLCAERCPTAAWDMQQFDLIRAYAGRSAS